MKRSIPLLLVFIIATIFFAPAKPNSAPTTPSVAETTTTPAVLAEKTETITTTQKKVTRVVDGDTIELEDGQKVRYIGIDTPETKDPRKGAQCFGQEAYQKNKELVEGKMVILEKDVSETDRFGRLLRYVYLPKNENQASSEAVFVNYYLVREGYAYASTYPPDVKYQEDFQDAQRHAQEAGRGLWKTCSVEPL